MIIRINHTTKYNSSFPFSFFFFFYCYLKFSLYALDNKNEFLIGSLIAKENEESCAIWKMTPGLQPKHALIYFNPEKAKWILEGN